MSAQRIITEHLDLWTSAVTSKSTSGRGSNGKIELTGIKKLRELILELAVRGKLVPQDPNDEPSSVLLEKIAEEKSRLLKAGTVKKPKKLAPIEDNEKPFPVPEGWALARLPDTYFSISPSGKKVKTSDFQDEGRFPVVDQGQSYIAGYSNDESMVIRLPNPVVVFGDHTKARKYVDFDFVAGADGTKILCPIGIYPKFFFTQLLNYKLESRGYARHFKILNDNLFTVPPLAEQHRIVEKVDELMALCDRLEQQTSDQLAAHETLVDALLDTLTRSQDAAELAENWSRLAAHFDNLFTTEHSIDRLKQTILQLAVMGRLVPQDPSDEPASVLLEKIAAEKERLAREGKIKKAKPLPAIELEETPFPTPENWSMARMDDITDIQSGVAKGKKIAGKKSVSLPYLRVANVQRGKLFLEDIKHLEISADEVDRYLVREGDLLITEGGDWDKVGRTAIWNGSIEPMIHQNHVFRARRICTEQNEQWIEQYLNSPFARLYFADSSKQTTNLASINKTQLRSCVVPIPPLAEQHRIVKRINELMSLCDQLKERLIKAGETRTRLAEAVVEQALT